MKIRTLILLSVLSIVLAGCNVGLTAQEDDAITTPTSILAGYLSTDFDDAASLRNQLALGILSLEGTPNAVTSEQSSQLLLLWQAYIALLGSDTSVPEEISAVQDQIAALLNDAQIQAIAAMQLTNTDLTEFYAEQGVIMSTPEPGMTPEGGRAGKSDLSQEEREAAKATAEALGTPVGSGSGSGQERQNIMFDSVIELLSNRNDK